MAETKRKSWPRRLLWLLVALAILYTVAWFTAAYVLDQRLDRQGSKAIEACKNRKIGGFPLSMSVQCERYALDGTVTSGSLLVSAPLTDLGRARVDLTPPMTITPPDRSDGGLVEVSWTELNVQGEVGLTSRSVEDVSLRAGDLIIRAGPHDMVVDALDVLVSEGAALGGVAQDAVLRADATQARAKLPYGLSLPPADLKLRATLRDGMARLAAADYRLAPVLANGADIDLHQLALSTPADGRIVLSGPLTLGADGLLSGTVSVGVANGQALGAFASTLGPQAQQVVAGLVQAIATAGQEKFVDGQTVRSIDVTLDRGEVRLGLFALGQIPPLRF